MFLSINIQHSAYNIKIRLNRMGAQADQHSNPTMPCICKQAKLSCKAAGIGIAAKS